MAKDKAQQVSLFVLKGALQMSSKFISTLKITLKNAKLTSFVDGLYLLPDYFPLWGTGIYVAQFPHSSVVMIFIKVSLSSCFQLLWQAEEKY